MAVRRHLSRAPIREALIDLHVHADGDPSRLSQCVEEVAKEYPKRLTLHRGEFGFSIDLEKGTSLVKADHSGLAGYRVDSEDGKQIAQFRLDGFTFSRLAPYQRWEEMRDEAKKIWAIYANHVKPDQITRAAVRYINVLELPCADRDFGEFFTAPPTLPQALPQRVSSFLQRIVFHEAQTAASIAMTMAFEGAAVEGNRPITLDIDVFCDRDFDPSGAEIWNYLEALRNLKNDVFFENITEETARLFE